MATAKKGLYANIHAKQERIAHGSGEHMRKPGVKGAPASDAFDKAAKTAKATSSKTASKKTPSKKTATKTTTARKTAAKKASPRR